jgi:xylan 1,4-beta-xylosidase
MKTKTLLPALLALTSLASADSFPVQIQVDASKPMGPLKPIWRFFGADEPNYATMKDGRELLGELGALKKDEVYFRAHNLLCTGDGTPALKWGSTNIYTEDAQGNPVYDWKIVDGIFDAYRQNGVRPFLQIGFMPKALSIKPEPYQHHWYPGLSYGDIVTGWSYPPKDYDKWRDLITAWVKHNIERYGKAEVEKWYFEVWNEPNGYYWKGTRDEFFKLHDYAVDGVRRALPNARVGGPHTAGAGGKFQRAFLEHCLTGTNYATGQTGTPLDFVAFHAKGDPKTVDGHVRMGISNQLRAMDDGFSIIGSYPETKNKPIIIGESDPEGCAACQGDQLAYRNGTMYSSYTAASFPRALDLADKRGVNLEGAVTWAFEFENQPYFAGFRDLATNGIDKPVLNVFRMFSKMDGERLPVQSDSAVKLDEMLKSGVRGKPDVSALASMKGKRATVLVWHYHDDDLKGDEAEVTLQLSGVPAGKPSCVRTLIDETHSNSFTIWKAQGSPQKPTAAQIQEMEEASKLAKVANPAEITTKGGVCELKFPLARQGVTLLELEWK